MELIFTHSHGGECDRCHCIAPELFGFEDDEPGDWLYCGTCARRYLRQHEGALS